MRQEKGNVPLFTSYAGARLSAPVGARRHQCPCLHRGAAWQTWRCRQRLGTQQPPKLRCALYDCPAARGSCTRETRRRPRPPQACT